MSAASPPRTSTHVKLCNYNNLIRYILYIDKDARTILHVRLSQCTALTSVTINNSIFYSPFFYFSCAAMLWQHEFLVCRKDKN